MPTPTSELAERYGPWALVAGASEGLGAAFAESLAKRGLNLVLIARREPLLSDLARRLERSWGIDTHPLSLDLGTPNLLERLVPPTQGLDIGLVVYNAARIPLGPFLDLPLEDHLAAVRVNCQAPLRLVHHFGAAMRSRGRGGILLMSSLAGFHGTAFVASYAATKAFNLIMAEGLWAELRRDGIDVVACCAGETRTPGFEASRPRSRSWLEPPVMDPMAVVEDALYALGRQPFTIPGLANRVASFLLRHLLSRRAASTAMSDATRGRYASPE